MKDVTVIEKDDRRIFYIDTDLEVEQIKKYLEEMRKNYET
jgi:hypothetical protein